MRTDPRGSTKIFYQSPPAVSAGALAVISSSGHAGVDDDAQKIGHAARTERVVSVWSKTIVLAGFAEVPAPGAAQRAGRLLMGDNAHGF